MEAFARCQHPLSHGSTGPLPSQRPVIGFCTDPYVQPLGTGKKQDHGCRSPKPPKEKALLGHPKTVLFFLLMGPGRETISAPAPPFPHRPAPQCRAQWGAAGPLHPPELHLRPGSTLSTHPAPTATAVSSQAAGRIPRVKRTPPCREGAGKLAGRSPGVQLQPQLLSRPALLTLHPPKAPLLRAQELCPPPGCFRVAVGAFGP